MKEIAYQEDAVNEMLNYTNTLFAIPLSFNERSLTQIVTNNVPTILLEAPTGSGKTVIMTKYLTEVFDPTAVLPVDVAVIWLCVGQGGLVEQSKNKIQKFAEKLNCLGPEDIINSSISSLSNKDVLFISWDKLNMQKDGEWTNILMRDGEGMNFPKLLANTHQKNTKIILIIDESHIASDSSRSAAIKRIISPDLVVNVTATPSKKLVSLIGTLSETVDGLTSLPMGKHIKVDILKVIDEGMIKRDLVINKDIAKALKTVKQGGSPITIILNEALKMRDKLENTFKTSVKDGISTTAVNPLLLIQISDADKGEETKEEVIKFLASKGIEYPTDENPDGTLACWFSKQQTKDKDSLKTGTTVDESKINLEDIEKPDAKQKVLLFKTAIATGWDCPRAYILVKFRESAAGAPFSRQVVGRILRMPEQKHYPDRKGMDALNKAYIYTNEEEFKFEMVNTDEPVDETFDKIKIYKTSICMQDKFAGMMEFSTQLPLPTYDTKDTVKVLSKDNFASIFVRELCGDSDDFGTFKKMIDFAESNQEKMNINLLLDQEYSVDQVSNSGIGSIEGKLDNKGQLRLQSNLVKLKIRNILYKCAGTKENFEILNNLLEEFRKFIMDVDDREINPLNDKGTSVWYSQPGIRKFNALLYINQYNKALDRGTAGYENQNSKDASNYLLSFFRSMFKRSYVIPNHDISSNHVEFISIPREAVLEIEETDEEFDEDDNKCLFGIKPSIKNKKLRKYIEDNIDFDSTVKWWYPNWILTKGVSQVRLPYIDNEGLLKTVKPDIIVAKLKDGSEKRVYTFLVNSVDYETIVNSAIENFKCICQDMSIDYEVVRTYDAMDEDSVDYQHSVSSDQSVGYVSSDFEFDGALQSLVDDDFDDLSNIQLGNVSALSFDVPV